ncbi:MAG: 3-deoxy-7-phosphoheptulonate synthase [Chloroflexota bacterium]
MPGVDAVLDDAGSISSRTRDLRIESLKPLIPPAILLEQQPLAPRSAEMVRATRNQISDVLNFRDDRLVVVVGPCSAHDPAAAEEYGRRLKTEADRLKDDLLIVMRVYFEKPRTTVGWKGLINDPNMDGSFSVNEGLHTARQLLLDLADIGVPAGCEFLDPILPQFITDIVTWGAIGARTTESQVHRELASGLSMPVGFKNGTGGGIQMAIDALRAAAYPHHFLSITEQGVAAIVATYGNPDCHVILRGGSTGPTYDATSVANVLDGLDKAKLPRRVMIDTSHGNSNKDYKKQPAVASAVAEQVAGGQHGIVGVLMESFLVDGRQDDPDVFGMSVTDSCMGWEMTLPVLDELAGSVRTRRKRG